MMPSPSASWALKQPTFVDHPLTAATTLEVLEQTHSSLAIASSAGLYLGLLDLPRMRRSRCWPPQSSQLSFWSILIFPWLDHLQLYRDLHWDLPFCFLTMHLPGYSPSELIHNFKLDWLEESKLNPHCLSPGKSGLLHYERQGLVVCHHYHSTWGVLQIMSPLKEALYHGSQLAVICY